MLARADSQVHKINWRTRRQQRKMHQPYPLAGSLWVFRQRHFHWSFCRCIPQTRARTALATVGGQHAGAGTSAPFKRRPRPPLCGGQGLSRLRQNPHLHLDGTQVRPKLQLIFEKKYSFKMRWGMGLKMKYMGIWGSCKLNTFTARIKLDSMYFINQFPINTGVW